ncbi:MAG: hypothetical protein Q9P90_10750 [candidate division KSB1 bacterium]|nr:hypothetical protein [candidate division KSB1 bacterium]
MMEAIHIVRAGLSQSQARDRLSRKRFLRGRQWPDAVELTHLPFYVFEMQLEPEMKEYGAVDGIHGTFLYFDPTGVQADPVKDAAALPLPRLDWQQAREQALAEYRRALLHASMRRGGRPWEIKRITPLGRFYLPYWIGYFRRGETIRMAVIDALSGEPQGPKIRRAILACLSSPTG